jgi:hypothetical protein
MQAKQNFFSNNIKPVFQQGFSFSFFFFFFFKTYKSHLLLALKAKVRRKRYQFYRVSRETGKGWREIGPCFQCRGCISLRP